MKNLKNKLFVIFSLLCALGLTSCMDLYDGSEVQTSFTVTFHGNGGTYTGTTDVTTYTQTFDYGEEKDLTKNQFVRSGYEFLGWAETEEASTVSYVDGSKFKTFADRNLYAVWGSGEFTVTFDANGGTGTMEPQIFKLGVTKKLPKNTFTYEGKGFAGWALSKDATTADYPDENTMSFNKDTTLYAVWANVYTVTFNRNGGTEGDMPAQSFTENVEQALNSNSFTRAGFDFSGWAKTPIPDGGSHEYENGQKLTLNSDLTLYAVWTRDSPNLYVASTGVVGNPGTEAAPFANLQSAISRINTVGDPTRAWTIYVNGTVVGDTEISALNANTLKIIDYASEASPDVLTPTPAVLQGSSKSVLALTSTTGCDITITNISITGGKGTTKTGNSTTYGGGIFINSSNTKLKLDTGVPVSTNTANNGGGIYIESGELTIASTATVNGNSCTVDGAGVYVAGGKLIFTNGEISGNTGATNGGGIYIAAGTVEMSGGSIKSHTATNGGGVYIAGGKFTLSGGNIGEVGYGNTASSGGGGVFNAGILEMTGTSCNIAGNSAANGGGVYNNNIFNMGGGTIAHNKADGSAAGNGGGGVYNAKEMNMYDEAVIGDSSAGTSASGPSSYSNYANNGGGVLNSGSGILILGSADGAKVLNKGIYYNLAATGGGVNNVGVIKIYSGNIDKNGSSNTMATPPNAGIAGEQPSVNTTTGTVQTD